MTDRRLGKDRIEGKDKAPPCLLHEGSLHEENLLYKNKYRIPSARLQHWDYGWNAAYFVTICTHNRQCFFGEISNGKMELSEMGKTATIYWMEIPDHFPFVNLGAFVVMPNHIHGIVVIDKPGNCVRTYNNEPSTVKCGGNANAAVKTTHALSLQSQSQSQSMGQNRFQNQGKNTLSSIIGSYKSSVTRNARVIDPEFAWQSRFHDHIIRDEKSYQNISQYIINNPANWDDDKFNSDIQGGI